MEDFIVYETSKAEVFKSEGKRGVRSPEKYYKDQQGFEIKKFEKLKEKQKQQTESTLIMSQFIQTTQ